MRLRLDKLVLSAGLALAMVATAVPVVPVKAAETVSATSQITTKVYSGSSIVDDLATDTGFISAVTGVSAETTTPSTSGSSKITKKAGSGTVTPYTLTDQLSSNSTDSAISNYLKNNGLKAVDSSTLVPTNSVKLEQVDTYDASYTYTVTEADETAKKSYSALIEAAEKKAAEELKKVTGSDTTESVPVTGGTKTIDVADGTAVTTVKTDSTNTVASADYDDPAVKGATIEVVTTGATVTNKYTITDLSSFGYTVKNTVSVTAQGVTEGAVVYKVLKVTKDFSVSEVESTLADGKLTYDITDLASSYMIAYSVESTSDALIVSAEDDATYTGLITQITDETTIGATAAEKLADAIEANSAKLVAYLNVGAKITETDTPVDETPNEITFKIAVPADVDTTGVVFKVLRYHGSSVDVLDTTVKDGYIYFTSDKFSVYALVTVAAADTTEEETNNETNNETESATEAGTETTTAGGTSTTSKTSSTNTADNSMMPLFMTTLLLALCAGSLAIYKEKKTN